MKRILHASAKWLILSCIVLCSCGGGGGGGQSDDDAIDQDAPFGVRLYNGSLEAPPVEMTNAGSGKVSKRAYFGEVTNFIGENGAEDTFSIFVRSQPTSVLSRVRVAQEKNEKTTILLFSDPDSREIRVASYPLFRAPDGSTVLRLAHTLLGAKDISLTVSIPGDSTNIITSYGEVSRSRKVASGMVSIAGNRIVDGRILFSDSVTLSNGRSYTYYVGGEVDAFVSRRLVAE
jgi:hypothetical protein